MKKLLLASVALSAMAGSALAADLPYRRAAPAPAFVAVPVFTWTGFYAGVNAGYGFAGDGNVLTTGATPAIQAGINAGIVPATVGVKPEGFVGGGQIGYNYQVGSMVLGVETDIQYTDLRQSVSTTSAIFPVTSTFGSKTEYLGTVRGRIGYAMDRFMVYATGGLAYGDVTNAVLITAPGASIVGGKSGTQTGYTVGAGVEYALPMFNFGGAAATMKAEYLYYDLGKSNVTGVGTANGATFGTARFQNDGHIVRAGLNWKFSAY